MKRLTSLLSVSPLLLPLLLLAACTHSTADDSASSAPESNLAKIAKLTSSDGHGITLSYLPNQIQVDGSSTTHTASNVIINVDHAGSAAGGQAVLVDDCSELGSPRFQLVDTCDLAKTADGSLQASLGSCKQTVRADNVDDHFPDILVDYSNVDGDAVTCTQEIAVVIDGNWLTDPINGTHDFQLKLQSF